MTKARPPAKKGGREAEAKKYTDGKNGKKSNAKIYEEKGDRTNSNESGKTTIDYACVKAYLHDIKDKTGFKVHATQISKLKEKLRTTSYSRLSVEDTAKHRQQFTTDVKNDCIKKWEENTGQTWPRYTETIYSKKGTIVRNIGDPYDAHHIIENCYNGDHEWWNITPAKFPDEHQAGLHGSGSPCNNLFK